MNDDSNNRLSLKKVDLMTNRKKFISFSANKNNNEN